MTLHKPRIPGTFSHAVTTICEAIGFDAAAEAVGKSQSLIRQWADPDNDTLPGLLQSVTLDTTYRELHEDARPPILHAYERMVRPPMTPRGECLNDALLNCHTSMSRLNQATVTAIAPTGPGGRRLTTKEAAHSLAMIAGLRSALDEMEARIKNAAPNLKNDLKVVA